MMNGKIYLFLIMFLCLSAARAQTPTPATFRLPEIKTMRYLSIPSALQRLFPAENCKALEGLREMRYSKRLRNIRMYEVYLVGGQCEFSQGNCLCLGAPAQGEFSFLILYDPKSKEATSVIASYNFLSDSEVYQMEFTLIGNKIVLTDKGYTAGDGGAEVFSHSRVRISVWKNGKIAVKEGLP